MSGDLGVLSAYQIQQFTNIGSGLILSGPINSASGNLVFRHLNSGDIPVISISQVSGSLSGFGGSGITSLTINVPTGLFTETGSPLTGPGAISIDLIPQTGNQFFAAPSTGNGLPFFRNIVSGDVPNLSLAQINGAVGTGTQINTATPLQGGGSLNSNLNLSISQASNSGNGYLASGDWQTFNNKVSSVIVASPSVLFNTPVTGNLVSGTDTVTLSFVNQSQHLVFSGPTSGTAAPTFRTLQSGDIPTLAYGQVSGTPVYSINTTGPLNGGGSLTGNLNLTISQASINNSGYLSSGDWNIFNNKISTQILNSPVALFGTPITGTLVSGIDTLNLNLVNQNQYTIFAGPTGTGAVPPSFRALVSGDIPILSSAQISGIIVGGSVTYIGVSLPTGIFSSTGSPITSSGNIVFSLQNQTGNQFWAAPSTGNGPPVFRVITSGDIPNLSLSQINGTSVFVQTGNQIVTTSPLLGGSALTGNLNLSISKASSSGNGYLASGDWSTFNNKITGTGIAITTNGFGAGGVALFGAQTNTGIFESGLCVIPLQLNSINPNFVFAGPSSGGSALIPNFRALVSGDIPTITAAQVTGLSAGGGSPGGISSSIQFKLNSSTFGGAGSLDSGGNASLASLVVNNGNVFQYKINNLQYFLSSFNSTFGGNAYSYLDLRNSTDWNDQVFTSNLIVSDYSGLNNVSILGSNGQSNNSLEIISRLKIVSSGTQIVNSLSGINPPTSEFEVVNSIPSGYILGLIGTDGINHFKVSDNGIIISDSNNIVVRSTLIQQDVGIGSVSGVITQSYSNTPSTEAGLSFSDIYNTDWAYNDGSYWSYIYLYLDGFQYTYQPAQDIGSSALTAALSANGWTFNAGGGYPSSFNIFQNTAGSGYSFQALLVLIPVGGSPPPNEYTDLFNGPIYNANSDGLIYSDGTNTIQNFQGYIQVTATTGIWNLSSSGLNYNDSITNVAGALNIATGNITFSGNLPDSYYYFIDYSGGDLSSNFSTISNISLLDNNFSGNEVIVNSGNVTATGIYSNSYFSLSAGPISAPNGFSSGPGSSAYFPYGGNFGNTTVVSAGFLWVQNGNLLVNNGSVLASNYYGVNNAPASFPTGLVSSGTCQIYDFIRNVTGNYTVTALNDQIIHFTGISGGTLTMPPTLRATRGKTYIVKDAGGAATSHNIIISGSGTNKIDGQTTYSLNSNYESVSLYTDGTNWFIY